jgi:uncharacterized membrane protein YqhA
MDGRCKMETIFSRLDNSDLTYLLAGILIIVLFGGYDLYLFISERLKRGKKR